MIFYRIQRFLKYIIGPLLCFVFVASFLLGMVFDMYDKSSPKTTMDFTVNGQTLLIDNSLISQYSEGFDLRFEPIDSKIKTTLVAAQVRDIDDFIAQMSVSKLSVTEGKDLELSDITNVDPKYKISAPSDLWTMKKTFSKATEVNNYVNPTGFKTAMLVQSAKPTTLLLSLTHQDKSFGPRIAIMRLMALLSLVTIIVIRFVKRISHRSQKLIRHLKPSKLELKKKKGGSNFTVAISGLILVVLSLSSLCACGSPSDEQSFNNVANMTKTQITTMAKSIAKTINSGLSSKNFNAIKARVTGPQKKVSQSEVALMDAAGFASHAKIPTSVLATSVTATADFPRYSVVVTATTKERETQRLYITKQKDIRSLHKIWGLVRTFSNVKIPAFNDTMTMLRSDDQSLAYSPKDLLGKYADLLQNTSKSKSKSIFSSDELQESLKSLTKNTKEAIEPISGTQKQTFKATKDILTVRTADGGAIMLGNITSAWTRKSTNGRLAEPIDEAEDKLLKGQTLTSHITVNYLNLVAFYIPPSSSGTPKVQAIGAERVPISITT